MQTARRLENVENILSVNDRKYNNKYILKDFTYIYM